jgi:hypothetical protein
MHTLRDRYLLFYGRVNVHTMCSRDVLEYHWIVDMLGLFCRIVIVIRGIVMHTLRDRYLLLYRQVRVYTMCGRDVLE